MVEARLMQSGGTVCIVEARSAFSNLGGSCLHSGGLLRPGVPSLS